MLKITATHQCDLCCTATHGPSSSTLSTDAPTDNQGLGRYFSPTDLVATGLGTCILTVTAIVAERHNLSLAGATIEVEKEMSANPRRIGRLPVKLTLPGQFTDKQKVFLERAAHSCPVHNSLHPDIDSPIEIIYPDC